LEAARRGDSKAWDDLVERYLPLVLSVARRCRLSEEDTADVSQTLWLRLVEHLDAIREPQALPGWIVTTTRNEALRVIKARTRSIPVDPLTGSMLDQHDGDAPEVHEAVLLAERHQALRDALAQMRPRQREFLLVLLEDPPLSYEQISSRLNIPKGSIGPTRARCLEELRRTPALRDLVASDSALRS
jgi:RNA polymerase sigma factor (sigma-70 family)